MSCFCLPRRTESTRTPPRPYLHCPNFTFSHSKDNINPRLIHSTFSIARNPKHKHARVLRRRHTLHNGTSTNDLKRSNTRPTGNRRRQRRSSVAAHRSAPPTVIDAGRMGSEQYQPPPGPPPGYTQQSQSGQQAGHVSFAGNRSSELNSNNPYHNAHLSPLQGPPPSSSSASGAPPAYDSPAGPPPGWTGEKKTDPNAEYAPPPGPPPSHQSKEKEDEPPPYDPWLAVPDSSFLPPPPSLRDERSPGANATWDDAAKGHAWCRKTALWPAQPQNSETLERIQAGDIYLTSPPASHTDLRNTQLTRLQGGKTHIRTSPKCTDTIFLSEIPVYPALSPSKPRTIYYELHVTAMGTSREEAGIAIGFLAPPYPSWRLPGWHRASIGVHGDDGRRFVDDSYGGVDFVEPFRKGDVVGVGMTFSPGMGVGGKMGVKCFFTRNGREEGGWDLHEEVDADADVGNVEGLEGGKDILAAVGCFGGCEFEVVMGSSGWKFRPEGV